LRNLKEETKKEKIYKLKREKQVKVVLYLFYVFMPFVEEMLCNRLFDFWVYLYEIKSLLFFFFIVGCKANWYNLSNCLFLPFSRAVFSACSRICVSSNFEISACDTRGRSSNSSSLSAFRVSMLKGSCDGKGESTGLIMPVVITEGTGGSWISANGLVLDGSDKLKGKFKKEDEEKVVEVDDEDEDEEDEDKRLLLVKKDDESEAKEAEMEGTDELDDGDDDDDGDVWFCSAFCWDWSWDWSWEVIWLVIANWACK